MYNVMLQSPPSCLLTLSVWVQIGRYTRLVPSLTVRQNADVITKMPVEHLGCINVSKS